MSVFSRAEIVEMIENYAAAEKAIMKGQAYSINGRSLTRVPLSDIREARQEWESRLNSYDVSKRGGNANFSLSTW